MSVDGNTWTLRVAWWIAIALWLVAVAMWLDIRGSALNPEAVVQLERPTPVYVAERQPSVEVHDTAPAVPADVQDKSEPDARQICGYGKVPTTAQEKVDLNAYLDHQTDLGIRSAVTALRSREDALSQAAAMMVEAIVAGSQISRRLAALECQPGQDCDAQRKAMAETANAQAPRITEGLIELARSQDDPWVYRLALNECAVRRGGAPGCAGLTQRRLTALEPDNAESWLELATHEPAATDEALFRASRADRFERYDGRLEGLVDDALPVDTPRLQRLAVLLQTQGFHGAAGRSATMVANRSCSEASLRDANRAQLCDGIARVMANKSGSLGDAGVGFAIGKRLGWPTSQQELFRDEQRVAIEVLDAGPSQSSLGCQSMDRHLLQMRDVARWGVRMAARRALERSSLTQAELLQRADATQAERAAQVAAEAASAATSATR